MSEQMLRTRRRITFASALAVACCTAVCLIVLCAASASSGLEAERLVLAEISNAPSVGEGGVEGEAPYHAAGVPSWARVAVGDDGSIAAVETSPAFESASDETDWAELVALRDKQGSEPFSWGGRVWLALWQPVGMQEGAMVVSADGVDVAAASAGEVSDGRMYTFLDVSEHVAAVHGLVLGCVATCGAVFSVALAVAWVAVGYALRPVAEAEERERAFVCAASHDLMTPLMAVTANCDVLEMEVADRPDLALWLTNIRAAADEMASRIAKMLGAMGREESKA